MNKKYSRNFQQLIVWQKAHELVLAIYRVTSLFPRSELFGLTAQLRRAAVSVAANIAEGYCRVSRAEKARFFNMAQSSLEEVRYYLLLVRDLNYIDEPELLIRVEEVSKLLQGYWQALCRPQ